MGMMTIQQHFQVDFNQIKEKKFTHILGSLFIHATIFFLSLSGAIVIKNWKPLPLDKVTDNTLISVSEIFGELTSNITLKITIVRTKPSQLAEIKDKLLKLLILQSHTVLRSSGCPLDEVNIIVKFE